MIVIIIIITVIIVVVVVAIVIIIISKFLIKFVRFYDFHNSLNINQFTNKVLVKFKI